MASNAFVVYGAHETAVDEDVIAEAAAYAQAGQDGITGTSEVSNELIQGNAGNDVITGGDRARDFIAEARRHAEHPRNAPRNLRPFNPHGRY